MLRSRARCRVGVVLAALAAAGCAVLRDAFSAHPAAAARAAGQTLTVERLAELASHVKGMPLEQRMLALLAGAYVDYTLFALTVAEGRSLDDTVVIARAMWPTVSQMKFNHFVERLSSGHTLNDRQIDSTYGAGELRAFQHILIAVPPSAAPPVVQQKQAQINNLWRTVVASGGATFAAVARQNSEDPASKVSGGYLDVGGRGRFVPQFEDAAWQLTPGGMSGVVRSSFGFHIIRRPPLTEIRDTYAAGVQRVLTTRFDSGYFAELAKRRNIRVASGIRDALQAAFGDLDAAGRSNQALASYRGGEFRMKDLVRWLYSLDPRILQAVPMYNDSQARALVQGLVERTVALQQAESAKAQLTDSDWTMVRTDYDSSLAILRALLKLDSARVTDASIPAETRTTLAMARVNDYFDRVVAGQSGFLPIPPLLAQVLRERQEWSIDPSGVRRAAERAVALRASADSLQPPGGPSPASGMRPAPGPAPVPTAPDSVPTRPSTRRAPQ